MRKLRSVVFLALSVPVLLVFPATGVRAQWIKDGTALCTATGNQQKPAIVSDAAGGAIVTWEDCRGGIFVDIYAQRVDAYGAVQWTTNGVALCTAGLYQEYPAIVPDGAGGAIVTWQDWRIGMADIYAQRVDASGAVQWTTNGVALCTVSGSEDSPAIASDGAGGAIVTWCDSRPGGNNADIYAQRVDAYGVVQWTTNGVTLCAATLNQYYVMIVSDGAGGAIATWHDERSDAGDIYAQRVDASGAVKWTTNGVALCTAAGDQRIPSITSDGAGGAMIVWGDYRSGNSDIYAQRVDASGAVKWTTNGVPLCTATGNQYVGAIVSDGAGGATVTWFDRRSGNSDVYAQRLNASGAVQWTTNGVALCTATGDQEYATIVPDAAGGAIVTWHDGRAGAPDIYAQRVDATGAVQWATNGIALCTAVGNEYYPTVASDGAGGAVVTWQDGRAGNYDIYAQRVSSTGVRGNEVPYIMSVSDVPNDQGGKIELQWDRCFILEDPDPTITYYSAWRRLPRAMSALATGASGIEDVSIDFSGVAHRMLETSSDYAWEWLANIPAKLIDTYAYMVQSRYDSTSSDTGWQYFVVTGHTDGLFVYYDSPPDSGYSVDNLSPCSPGALAAEYIGNYQLYIHWHPNTEADLHHYAVYKGAAPNFVPDESNRIGTATDSSFIDDDFGYDEYYYKVSAWDVHENEGLFSLLSPDMITGTPGGDRRRVNVLFQNAPNPFLSSTSIAFSMKEEGHVRLSVFDARGRLVRVLLDGVRGPSSYVEEWDGRDESGRHLPSGTYFYLLEVPGWSDSKKMTLTR